MVKSLETIKKRNKAEIDEETNLFEKIGKVVGKNVEKVKLGCDPVEIKSCDC